MTTNDNGWKEWSKYVLAELKSLNNKYENINKILTNHLMHTQERLTVLETSLRNWKYFVGLMVTILGLIIAISGLIR